MMITIAQLAVAQLVDTIFFSSSDNNSPHHSFAQSEESMYCKVLLYTLVNKLNAEGRGPKGDNCKTSYT